ncbi:hypothetical protein [Streptomyces sp. NPDC002537]
MKDPPRTTPRRRTAAICTLLVATALVSGCSDSRHEGASATATTTAPAVSDIRTCTRLISYWAEETITGGHWAGLDWEQKGLSNDQFAIFDDIVRTARTEQRQHGTDAARKLIERQTEQRCTAAGGATHSSENWRPPT